MRQEKGGSVFERDLPLAPVMFTHLAVLVDNRRHKEVNHVPTDLGGRAENLT
jgi:hypothetical protein